MSMWFERAVVQAWLANGPHLRGLDAARICGIGPVLAVSRRSWGGRGTPGLHPVFEVLGTVSAQSSSHAAVFHTRSGWRPYSSSLAGSAGRLATASPGRTCRRRSTAVRFPRRAASRRRHPSPPLRTPAVSSPPASSLDHSPAAVRALDPTPSPSAGVGGGD